MRARAGVGVRRYPDEILYRMIEDNRWKRRRLLADGCPETHWRIRETEQAIDRAVAELERRGSPPERRLLEGEDGNGAAAGT